MACAITCAAVCLNAAKPSGSFFVQNSIFVPSFIKFLKSVTLPSTFATSASLAKLRENFFATSNRVIGSSKLNLLPSSI